MRNLLIFGAVVALVGVCFLPPPPKSFAIVADYTFVHSDGVKVPAGASDIVIAFSNYKPHMFSIKATTGNLNLQFNGRTSGIWCDAGDVLTLPDISKDDFIDYVIIDRGAADAGFQVVAN